MVLARIPEASRACGVTIVNCLLCRAYANRAVCLIIKMELYHIGCSVNSFFYPATYCEHCHVSSDACLFSPFELLSDIPENGSAVIHVVI